MKRRKSISRALNSAQVASKKLEEARENLRLACQQYCTFPIEISDFLDDGFVVMARDSKSHVGERVEDFLEKARQGVIFYSEDNLDLVY